MFVSTQVHLGFQHFNQKLVHRDVSFLRIQEFNAKCYLYCIILDLQTCTCLILAQNILIIVSTCLKHGSSSRSFSSLSFVLPDLVRDRGHVIYSRYTAIQQIYSRYAVDIQIYSQQQIYSRHVDVWSHLTQLMTSCSEERRVSFRVSMAVWSSSWQSLFARTTA